MNSIYLVIPVIMINKLKREGMVYKSIISQKYYFKDFLIY